MKLERFHTAGITAQAQPMPEFHEAEFGIPPTHIPDEPQFCVRMCVGRTGRQAGMAGEEFDATIVPRQTEVNVRLAFIVLAPSLCDTEFLCVLYQGLLEAHVLRYRMLDCIDNKC